MNRSEELIDLSKSELININGGASFSYRAGLFLSMVYNWGIMHGLYNPGYIAADDWFCN